MPKVVYEGGSHAVDIAIDGGFIHAEKGEPVEVPDALAKSLCKQDSFSLVDKKEKAE